MLNRFFGKYGKQIAQCALIVGIISSQGACRFCFHQPKLPESMKQLLGQQQSDGRKEMGMIRRKKSCSTENKFSVPQEHNKTNKYSIA